MKINAGDGSIDIGDKSTPNDAQVIAAILRDMGITEYEPRVINQVKLDFKICLLFVIYFCKYFIATKGMGTVSWHLEWESTTFVRFVIIIYFLFG